MAYITLTIPCYYIQKFKTKDDKTLFINLNWWRNAHYFIKNEVKQAYTSLIIKQLKALNAKPIKGKYELAFKYYYKNVTSDLDNVCAMANKHFNDAAQAFGLVENDNVKHCIKSCYYVAEQDKENPRIEIFVRKVEDEL
jgi:Holliday junction resolvase RusA-like endonuclease